MQNVPEPRIDLPNHSNYQPAEEMIRLRKRIIDLLKFGNPSADTYLQTIMQVWQQGETRRQQCLQEAEDYRRKYHASLSQAAGFAAQSSILYSVINGYATLEERRIEEMAGREKERAESTPSPVETPITTPPTIDEMDPKPKRGRPRKA